jgi:hypothetical protein
LPTKKRPLHVDKIYKGHEVRAVDCFPYMKTHGKVKEVYRTNVELGTKNWIAGKYLMVN